MNGEKQATDEPSEAEIEQGRLFFASECRFVLGVAHLDQLPAADRNDIAFAGRSNVGKSSLLNALTGRRSLARTSKTPGRTQQLNYFALERKDIGRLYLVDLPGYGFAQAPKESVQNWTRMIKSYLLGRASLRRTFLLIDARHGIKDVDAEIMDLLDETAVSYQVILTKIDKIKASDLTAITAKTELDLKKRVAAHPTLIATSSEKGLGIAELRAAATLLASPF